MRKKLLIVALGAFALANKAGEVMFGFTKVEQAIAREKVLALLHASDAAEDGCRKLDARLRAQTRGAEAPTIRVFTSDELDLASGDCRKSLDLNPDNADALYNFACIFSKQNNTDKALEHLSRAIELNPSSAQQARNDLDLQRLREDTRGQELLGG